jgi:hypothetical protein
MPVLSSCFPALEACSRRFWPHDHELADGASNSLPICKRHISDVVLVCGTSAPAAPAWLGISDAA